jgi:nickel superoxide dismutase
MRRTALMTAFAAGVAATWFITTTQRPALAHCEIPCGIYDDHARIVQMLEDATTIAKSVEEITSLSDKGDSQSRQQLVRWTMNKEHHATKIQDTIAQYFMTQRIKPVRQANQAWNDYVMRLVQHHAVMVAAMKTKQQVDPATVQELRSAIEAIAVYYPAPDDTHATTGASRR